MEVLFRLLDIQFGTSREGGVIIINVLGWCLEILMLYSISIKGNEVLKIFLIEAFKLFVRLLIILV